MGQDLLVSVDPGGDGWLVGRDNLQARIGVRDGKPVIDIELLDATNVTGPTYRSIAGMAAASRVAIGPDGTIEASIVDPGLGLLPTKPGKLAVRIDPIAPEIPTPAANVPRTLTGLTLVDERDAGFPSGFKVKTDFNDIATIPGETATVRFAFSGTPMPKRVALRTEGLGREATSAMELPFPESRKGVARVEYKTRVQPDATLGYRVARATLTGADGVPSVVQASFRVAPLADVVLNDTTLKPSTQDRSIKVGFTVFGNSSKRLSGHTTISVAGGGYRVLNGDESQKVGLFEPRRGLPRSFGLFVPANARGTVPIRFGMEIGGKKFEIVRYLTID